MKIIFFLSRFCGYSENKALPDKGVSELRSNHAPYSSQTVCKLFANRSHSKELDADLNLLSPKLPTIRTGKLACWLASRVTPSVVQMTRQVGQTTCCFQFESTCFARFASEFMTFSWCLWRAHWFLWNPLEVVCGSIDIRLTNYLHSYCWCEAWIAFCSFTTWHSVSLGHTADLSWH